VLSVLSLAAAARAPLTDGVVLANIAAGVVVRKLGTATLTPPELRAALRDPR
jgi:D-beta-D-heptose 7-phosphate kinase/D-beta-D-heptose 1-phosphate adenosyltransferase